MIVYVCPSVHPSIHFHLFFPHWGLGGDNCTLTFASEVSFESACLLKNVSWLCPERTHADTGRTCKHRVGPWGDVTPPCRPFPFFEWGTVSYSLPQCWKSRACSDRAYWPIKKNSAPTVSQHDALHITAEHIIMLELTQLPVELRLFLASPTLDTFSQRDSLNAGQVAQHVIWQRRHAWAR